MHGLQTAAASMTAQSALVNNTAQKIANTSTTAFKGEMLVLQSVTSQTLKQAGSLSSSTGTMANVGNYLGGGVRVAGKVPILTQGNLNHTGRETDLAIVGNGYFQIEMPDGSIGYTRDGTFTRGADGTIETVDGYKVLPGITVPENATAIMVNASGEVEAKIPGQVANQNLGQIQLAIFANPAGLEPVTGNLFLETAASGGAIVGNPNEDAYGRLHQRALEASNVEAVNAVVELIKGQRGYEMGAKALSTMDQMLKTLNDRVGA